MMRSAERGLPVGAHARLRDVKDILGPPSRASHGATSLPPKPTTTSRTGPAGTNARGDATRERLIIVAERLFAERGIAAVTFIDISRAAGQRNNVAIPYHFGDRDGLVGAITRYRAQPSE